MLSEVQDIGFHSPKYIIFLVILAVLKNQRKMQSKMVNILVFGGVGRVPMGARERENVFTGFHHQCR